MLRVGERGKKKESLEGNVHDEAKIRFIIREKL